MYIMQIIFIVIMSVAIGLFMGIIGGGGGGIYVIILMVMMHENAKSAAMTALVLSTITLCGAAGQYWRKRQMRMDYFVVLAILDIIGTLVGNVIMNNINENILKIIIVCVLVLSGLSSLIKIKSLKNDESKIDGVFKKLPVALPVGLLSGLITGITGLSGSTMLSSYLIGLLDFSPYLAVGTTTLVSFAGNLLSIVILGFSSAIFHTSYMQLDIKLLLILGIGSSVGAIFGARFTAKINRKVLTIILAAMAIIPGIYLAVKG